MKHPILTKSEMTVLVLQGGGALGSYQAGAYQALESAGISPQWVSGISIGAINAALIAGNAPEMRVKRLHEFWELISSSVTPFPLWEEAIETIYNQTAAANTMMLGAPGFFTPRWLQLPDFIHSYEAKISYYDTAPLKQTLLKLVDFDLLNSGRMRISVGAVNITTGNFTYFDSAKMHIGPEHIMASGALPPAFPPIEIDGEYYWDGGLVSNTPLQYILDENITEDLTAFQIDLFSARGPMVRNMAQVAEREKDIRFSSRTRHSTNELVNRQKVAAAAANLQAKLPKNLQDDPDLAFMLSNASPSRKTIMQLIYKAKHTDTYSKDYEFSRMTMKDHWKTGKHDVEHNLAQAEWLQRGEAPLGTMRVYDFCSSASHF